MVKFKVISCRRREPSDWLHSVWVPFHLKYHKLIKRWPSDRNNYARLGARAANLLRHIQSFNVEGGQEHRLTKTFDRTEIVSIPFGATSSVDKKVINAPKRHDSYHGSKEMIDACYGDISPNCNGKLLGRAPLKVGAVPTEIRLATFGMRMASISLEDSHYDPVINVPVITGGWVGAKRQFERFTLGTFKLNTKYNKRLKNISKFNECCKIKAPPMSPKISDIYYAPLRGDSCPGSDVTNSWKKKEKDRKSVV